MQHSIFFLSPGDKLVYYLIIRQENCPPSRENINQFLVSSYSIGLFKQKKTKSRKEKKKKEKKKEDK